MAEITLSNSEEIIIEDVQTAPNYIQQKKLKKIHTTKIVNKYIAISGGVGFIPLPFFDQVIVGGLLAKMLSELCQVYHVKLTDHKIKVIVASVLGGAHSDWITYYLTTNVKKFVPALMIGGIFIRPIVAGTIVYGIGQLFIHHLESGAWLK